MTSKPKFASDIVIAISGGVVTGVFSDLQARITVVDWDDVDANSAATNSVEYFSHDKLEGMPADLQGLLLS